MAGMAGVVEFHLFSSVDLTFKKAKTFPETTRKAVASADNLENVKGCSTRFLDKLENLLMQTSPDGKRRRLSNPPDSSLAVEVRYVTGTKENGCFNVEDGSQPDGLLTRLVRICGGPENVKADLELEFGTSEDKMKLTRKDKMLNEGSSSSSDVLAICGDFEFKASLADKWETQVKFTGTLTLTLKLNQEAVNRINLKGYSLDMGAVNRKLLEEAETFGDTVILLENGAKVRCHKGFLAAQSDVFKAMFTSGMKEANSCSVEMRDVSERGVRALLAYLYCGDVKEAWKCSLTATELLTVADKYGISSLFETMRDLILEKESGWFTVAAAIQLMSLGRNRAEEVEFKGINDKVVTVLRAKSREELKQCAEFQEMLSNPETAFEMCAYIMQSK